VTNNRKKLIEVALPLPEINDASAYDKMPGIGPHPKGIHHWWARLPLPTARAVLFASVVDDPSSHPERFPTEEAQAAARERLFGILRALMQKRMHEHPEVYAEARAEMLKYCDGKMPPVLDPFAGGGSIPLEAARFGFEAYAADLNPVAVLLNKCNLELVPRWLGHPPVNPHARDDALRTAEWRGVRGLAEDVRYYGRLIRQRAIEKIGHLYPKIMLPKEYGGRKANVIAWIWARTVASPDPAACGAQVPLMSTFWLSSKKGSLAWLRPIVDRVNRSYRFEVRTEPPPDRRVVSSGTKVAKGSNFKCLLTGAPIKGDYIQEQARHGLGKRLVAIVADLGRGRTYVPATEEHEVIAEQAKPRWYPEELLSTHPQYMGAPRYGMVRFGDLFSPRQLTAMVTLSDLVREIREDVRTDAEEAGLNAGDAEDYAATVTTFLALALDRCADFNNAICRWTSGNQKVMNLFSRQAIPMVWDFAEANVLGDSVGAWSTCSDYVAKCIEVVGQSSGEGRARQIDAASSWNELKGVLVSTDPPYYDNIPYSDISDFFYIWLRRTIGTLHRDLFSTVLTPKNPELVASSLRHEGDLIAAKEHFETGFRKAFGALREKMDPRFPLTVYYAFKQEDEAAGNDEGNGRRGNGVDRTTGWETLLEALLRSGFRITATWPVRASQSWRMRAMGSNALASYIVLSCRPRTEDSPQCSRREFLAALKRELPRALKHLQQGNIAPVDLAQAAIGPGMAVFSRYAQVLEADGSPMSVRSALIEINRVLDETLAEQEGDMDQDTRFCVAWFEQYGTSERSYGEAEVLFTAKNTSFEGLQRAGVIVGGRGKVRLKRRDELNAGWDPTTDKRLTDWECVQHLVRAMTAETGGGIAEAARLVVAMGSARAENARALAYRLFTVSERKGWTEEALAYNILVTSWPQIQAEVAKLAAGGPTQSELAL